MWLNVIWIKLQYISSGHSYLSQIDFYLQLWLKYLDPTIRWSYATSQRRQATLFIYIVLIRRPLVAKTTYCAFMTFNIQTLLTFRLTKMVNNEMAYWCVFGLSVLLTKPDEPVMHNLCPGPTFSINRRNNLSSKLHSAHHIWVHIWIVMWSPWYK